MLKKNFDKMISLRTETIFPVNCISDSTFIGQSTPTIAFDGFIQYFTYTILHLHNTSYSHIKHMHEGIWCAKKNLLQNDSY